MRYRTAFSTSSRTPSHWIVSALAFVVFVSLFITTTHAYTLLGEREIRMGSSETGAVNNYQVDFDVSTTGDLGGIVITFCADSPIINDTDCEAPSDMNLTNILNGLDSSDIDMGNYFISPSQHVSAGSATNTVVITPGVIPDNTAWSQIDTLSAAADIYTNYMTENSQGNLFLSYGPSSEQVAYLYRSTDGGNTWMQIESVSTTGWVITDHLLETSDGTLLWSFGDGDRGSGTAYIYRSTDGGNNWSQIEAITDAGTVWSDYLIEASNGDLLWSFAGSAGVSFIYRSVNGGVTWDELEDVQTHPRPYVYLESLGNGVVLWTPSSYNNQSLLYRSNDNGATWSEVASISVNTDIYTNYLLEVTPQIALWSFSANDTAYIYRSTDAGLTWAEVEDVNITSTADSARNHLLKTSSGTLLWSFESAGSVNEVYIYRSDNNGASWVQVEGVDVTDAGWGDTHLIEDSGGDLLWSFSGGGVEYLYLSIDDGLTWTEAISVNVGEPLPTTFLLNKANGDVFWTFGSADAASSLLYVYSPSTDPAPVLSAISGESVIFELANATNPSTLGTFYARIYTYADPAHALGYTLANPSAGGPVVDAGGIAMSTAELLTIQSRVQERLTFCIYTGAADYETCAVSAASPVVLGDANGVLSSSNPSVSVDGKYNITTNASQGATIRMKGGTLAAGPFTIDAIGDVTPGDGIAATSQPNSEQFGLCTYRDPNVASAAGLEAVAPYNHVNCSNITSSGQGPGVDAGAEFAFDTSELAATYGHPIATKIAGDWSTGVLVFLGNITNVTEPGIYVTELGFVATGRY